MNNPISIISKAFDAFENRPINTETLLKKYVRMDDEKKICRIATPKTKYVNQIIEAIQKWPDDKQPSLFIISHKRHSFAMTQDYIKRNFASAESREKLARDFKNLAEISMNTNKKATKVFEKGKIIL